MSFDRKLRRRGFGRPIVHRTNDPAIMVAMLDRCPNCGAEGRTKRTCAESMAPPEEHRVFQEMFGPEHTHMFCPKCGREGLVGPPEVNP